jgi:hypothetical protein
MDRKVKYIFVLASSIFFVGVTVFWLILAYDHYLVSKDGEFCAFRQSWESNYDFEFPSGRRCDFLITGLVEPLIVFLLAHTIFQAPLWAVYGGIRFVTRLLRK